MSAKRVVLELLTAVDGHELAAVQLIAGADVVGVSANNVRVTLTRLVAAGTLEVTGRGQYKLGKRTEPLTKQITSWRELEAGVRRWDGGWVLAHGKRDRSIDLLGFRELDGLWNPTDNLAGGVAGVRGQLAALGSEALVMRATELDAATDARARRLWDGAKLSASYVRLCERIESWLASFAQLPLRRAAREAFVFGGGEVLRALLFDPRLPEPLVDVAARRALVDAMIRLDRVGRTLWERLAEEAARAA